MKFKSIKEIEKEIEELKEGCGKEIQEEYDLDSDMGCGEDFENENSESGASFLLCKNCLKKLHIRDAKLQTLKQITEIIEILQLNCPIQKDKECWCKPLEELLNKINGESK